MASIIIERIYQKGKIFPPYKTGATQNDGDRFSYPPILLTTASPNCEQLRRVAPFICRWRS